MFTQHLGNLCRRKLLFLQRTPATIWPEETALQRRPASSWAGSLHANFPYPFSMGIIPVSTLSASLLVPVITPLLPHLSTLWHQSSSEHLLPRGLLALELPVVGHYLL